MCIANFGQAIIQIVNCLSIDKREPCNSWDNVLSLPISCTKYRYWIYSQNEVRHPYLYFKVKVSSFAVFRLLWNLTRGNAAECQISERHYSMILTLSFAASRLRKILRWDISSLSESRPCCRNIQYWNCYLLHYKRWKLILEDRVPC